MMREAAWHRTAEGQIPTAKQVDVLAYLSRGFTIPEAAKNLDCKEQTLKRRAEALKAKFASRTLAQLLWRAAQVSEVCAVVEQRARELGL